MTTQIEDRRQVSRSRVIYGGTVVYNQRQSTLDCVVQNFSEFGAKITLDNPALLPDRVDLLVNRKGRAFRADVIWRSEHEVGLSFEPEMTANAPVSLDWARRLRDCERERRALRARLDQLTS